METNICTGLDAYLSEAMDFAERSAFESHLASCSICQEQRGRSLEIERLLFVQNESVVMRQAFQERVLASLAGAREADLQSVELSLRDNRDRPVAIHTVLSWSIGTVMAAAAILWFALFIPKRSGEELTQQPNSNGDEVTREQIGSTVTSQAMEEHAIAVVAAPGYLCARIESEDPDIEFYMVRPALQKN